METLYQENGDHKMKMQFSVVTFKVSMLFEVPDHVLKLIEVRNRLKNYLNTNEGSVPWQIDYVRRTSHYAV